MPSKTTWQTVFRPEFTNGGIDFLTRGTTARLFDDFESYSSDAALQAVWSVTNGAGGDPRRTTAANAVRGLQSMQVTATGGTAVVLRGIPNNTFHFPAPGRIRYISFKGVVTTGTSAIRVRLSDASDATLYKEWAFTLSTDKTLDYIIDLYSGSTMAIGGGGFLNTESYPGPAAEGATAWNQNLIDRLEFRNLTDGSIFRFDDIRFYYEYSLLDALGFGTEPQTDDGADGSVHSKLRYLNNLVLQKIGETQQYSKYGAAVLYLNNSYTFGLELKSSLLVPSTTEITPGNYTIDRIRNGTTTNIVASTTATEAAGFISATYTPLEDNWQPGDQLLVTFSGGLVDKDTDTAELLTANAAAASTLITVANAALFVAGQRVRIYDDTPDTEIQTIVSIDSPTTLTVGALANTYTTAANARIVLVERTTLETARLASNITYEPQISQHEERWVLADYDDFDRADADGNTERWDTGYIADSDGGAAGTEGGTADINTAVAGQARVRVDPDATPTRAAYALKRDEPSRSQYYTVAADADVTLDVTQATSTYAGLRVSAGDVDDPANYVLIAREASTTVNRITARAEFAGVLQTTVNFSTTDNAVAFKIERYGNVWNVFYSLTQWPNWVWVKLTQFEDASGDMTAVTSAYLYAESGGAVDAQIATGDFDNFKYYIGSGALDQLLATSVLASGTFTTSSASVPADTGRLEGDNYWNGTLLMPVTGVAAFQPRTIVDFANAGGVFTVDPANPFTVAPAVGDEYVILVFQYPLVAGVDAGSGQNTTAPHVIGNKTDTAQYDGTNTASSIVRLLRAVHRGEILATGTLTTSSATVPADTGRLEANSYWDGCWLMPVTGAVAFQPRLIVDFINAGGVFTLDAQHPLTAAPGTVAYVILAPNYPLQPAADATTNTTTPHTVGNKADTASYSRNSTNSLMRYLKGLHTVEIIATGTFTTSSATVPADTGRAEGNDYWNGSWLIPLTGSVALQPRLITSFVNAGGVFTVDAQQPFTAATGLVTYVIVSPNSQLVPAADATTNTTPAHVVGNKSDAAAVAAGTASIIARLRAIEAALSVNAVAGGEFELDGDPDLWDALVNNSSADASITTTTGNRDASVIQRLAAIINAHGITDAGTATGFEEDGTGGTLWQSLVAVKGTFTASSATVPADTGRTEADNYFNGDLIIPLSGAVVGQARVIADFANGGGVFTLDSELPFTAASGLVDYIIVHYKYPLVPAVDSAANTTSAHIIGNKSDAASVAAGTASLVARLRAIEAALSVNAAGGGEFELDGVPDLWDALVADSSAQADITTLTGNRDASVIQRLAALINALQIADAASATGFEEDGTGGRLWESLIAVKGTFTTSSATVPADTGRTEANNYFNGDVIVALSGAVVRQARVIVGFANAGGVFTLDPQNPFTAAPGLVDYVILHFAYPLVPAADATSNTTSPHVVGNKTDAIPAMNLAPGNDSIVAHAKAILERLGATPADPDDSVLTNLGQRDDTATADTLADVTTTSIQAKLRRLLLRFSSDAFSATIQGAARTDIENMLSALATYLSSAGAAWSVTANPGGAARDNLEQTLEDFADVLAGAAGITTFPVRAVAADGVSLAEVLRHAAESIGENTANNAFDSSTVAENGDGSVLERLEELRGTNTTGTFTRTAAMGTGDETVANYTPLRPGRIAALFDLNSLVAAVEGGLVTVRLQFMIDGVNLRVIDRADFLVGTDNVHPTVSGFVVEGASFVRLSLQVNSAVTVNRDIPYRIIEAA